MGNAVDEHGFHNQAVHADVLPGNHVAMFKGFDAHYNQIALAAFDDMDWLGFLMRQIRNCAIIVAKRSGRFDNHSTPLLNYSIGIILFAQEEYGTCVGKDGLTILRLGTQKNYRIFRI